MIMNKICTSIEQSRKLVELGINIKTSDMYYLYDYNINEYEDDAQIISQSELGQHFSLFPEDIPAWSLSALLELMPERIKIGEELSFCLTSKKSLTGFGFGYNLNGTTFVKDNPVDAAFEMVCWLKENNKI